MEGLTRDIFTSIVRPDKFLTKIIPQPPVLKYMKTFATLMGILIAFVSMSTAQESEQSPPSYRDAVLNTAAMAENAEARALAEQLDLQILNLTWEDTGRYQDSAVGPNISDMTIQVAVEQPDSDERTVHCMPVIRFPNFSDKSADLDPEKFHLLVGNEKGQPLRQISLREFLDNPTLYLHDAGSWSGEGRRSLLAPKRDSRVLVSAQACFLPVPLAAGSQATFNPVLFNYQSTKDDPAVLTILVTREGTSTTIIDNTRDAFEEGGAWGQRLFFNNNGERASLTGERESQFKGPATDGNNETVKAADESGLNLVLMIQVPLKQRNPMTFGNEVMTLAFSSGAPETVMRSSESDVENAVIGHGEMEGPFTELDRLPIERDPDFPIRVTVQFYKATSNGVVSEADLQDIKKQIDRVYAQGDYVGSLVTESDTGRITEYDGPKVEPADWWKQFWTRHEENTGDTKEEAIAKLRKLLGEDYITCPVNDEYLNTLLTSTDLPEGINPRPAEEEKGLLKKIFGK
tara:strand:- start:557 stop:2107 length:1551 start_codon:yes stop_codon:yes gene_type:complete